MYFIYFLVFSDHFDVLISINKFLKSKKNIISMYFQIIFFKKLSFHNTKRALER
jgi:hypothetical protein